MSYKEHLHMVPDHMHGAVERYVDHGIPPGSFLTAVLASDLQGAVGRADHMNKTELDKWAEFVYNYLPHTCHGSYEIVNDWIKQGGLEGLKENA